jgi:hypothetical protein
MIKGFDKGHFQKGLYEQRKFCSGEIFIRRDD